jgi:transposase
MPLPKYIVRLTAEERAHLEDLIRTGKRAASALIHARILLKADGGEGGPGWDDERIAEAVECGTSTVYRVRQAFVEEGLAAALFRKKPTDRQYRKLDGAQEAQLIALACGTPPEGRNRWTLQLLADRLVELEAVESISPECVRMTLKKRTQAVVAQTVGDPAPGQCRVRVRPWRMWVMDNLNTHKPAALYQAFEPAVARCLIERLEIHHTPKHGSWLNMAEIELSVLSRQCLDRRLPDALTLTQEVAAWEQARNASARPVDWRFTTPDARIKLKPLYPSIQNG